MPVVSCPMGCNYQTENVSFAEKLIDAHLKKCTGPKETDVKNNKPVGGSVEEKLCAKAVMYSLPLLYSL